MNEVMRQLLAKWEKQTYAAEQIPLPKLPTFDECLLHPGQSFVMFNKFDSRQVGKWIDNPYVTTDAPALPAPEQGRRLADETATAKGQTE